MVSAKRLTLGVVLSLTANFTRVVIQIVTLPLMGRLLGPEEIGLYALAMPVLSFVLLISDAGLGDSLAREKTQDSLVWSSAFWGLLASSSVLACVVYGASFFIAAISAQPRLPQIMLPLCSTILMVAFTVIPSALMLRSGNFISGALGDMFANIVGAALAVYMAFAGYGVWALVAQYIVMYFVRMVIYNILQPIAPRFEFSLKSLLSHFVIGGSILGTRLFDLAGRLLENAQISRRLGGAALGNYGYANQIGRFFSDALGNPLWANTYYIAINKDREQVITHYVRTQRIFALLMFPSATILALAMPTLVPTLLGHEWADSTHPLMLLLLTYPFASLGTFSGAVLFANSKPRIVLTTTFGLAVARVLVVALGYSFGLTIVAAGLGLVSICYFLYIVFFVSRHIGSDSKDTLRAIGGPLLAAVLAGICLHFLNGQSATLLKLVITGVAAFLIYALALFLLDGRRLRTDISQALEMLRGRP